MAILRADCCAVGHGTGRITVRLLANFTQRQDAHLLRVHFPGMSEGLMLEALTWVRKAGLLEILLRSRPGNGLLEIHLELRHELLVLGRCWGISTTVVGEVTLHVGRLLLHVVQVRGVVHLVRLIMSRGEGARGLLALVVQLRLLLSLLSHVRLHVTTAVVAEATIVGRCEVLFRDRRIVIHLLTDLLVRRSEATLFLERSVHLLLAHSARHERLHFHGEVFKSGEAGAHFV